MIHSYNFPRSSLNLVFNCSLFNLRAAVTNPDSGVHWSGINLIFAGVSNLSSFAAFATYVDINVIKKIAESQNNTLTNKTESEKKKKKKLVLYFSACMLIKFLPLIALTNYNSKKQ